MTSQRQNLDNEAEKPEQGFALSKSRKQAILIGFIGFAGLAALSYYWFVYLERFIQTDDAYVESELFPVASKIPGTIKEIRAREGERVTKDGVLAILEDRDLRFERDFKLMKAKKARSDFKRAEKLHTTHSISDFDFETAETALRAAEADLQTTDFKIEYTRIPSPAEGFVARKTAQLGQVIQPGQNLFIVSNGSEPWVKANFKETQVRSVRVGQTVKVEIDAYGGVALDGIVESIFPSTIAKMSVLPPENSTGNFTRVVQRIPVRIKIVDALAQDLELRPGSSARVTIDTRNYLNVPKSSRVPTNENSSVRQ